MEDLRPISVDTVATRPQLVDSDPGPNRFSSHMPGLDAVRGIAISMVMAVHFVGDTPPLGRLEELAVRVANYGVYGVDLFFVLSGFLITGILHDAKNSLHFYRNFYVRRTLRIFPLYYAVLFLIFAVWPLLGAYPAALAESARYQVWMWTYLTNVFLATKGDWSALPYVGHFWSLAVEEHFYLIWPFVILTLSRLAAMRLCVLLIGASLGLRLLLVGLGFDSFIGYVLTPCRLDYLCTGGFLALAVRSAGERRWVEGIARSAWVPVIGALSVLPISWLLSDTPAAVALEIRATVLAFFFGALVILAVIAEERSLVGRCFRSRCLRFLGKYSYGVYIYHGILAYWMLEHGTVEMLTSWVGAHTVAVVLHAMLGVALSIAIAVLSFEGFEKPFLRLKSKFEG